MIRQFGALVPLGFVAYLALDGLVTRRWRWREILSVAAIPVLVAAGWYVWTRDWAPTGAALLGTRLAGEFLFKPNWPGVFLNRALTTLPLVALFAWTAVKLRPGRLWLAAGWAAILGWGVFTISLPQESHTFTGYGNILRTGGIDFFEYDQQPIWTPQAWAALAVLGAGLAALMLAKMNDAFIDWVTSLRSGRDMSEHEAREGAQQRPEATQIAPYMGYDYGSPPGALKGEERRASLSPLVGFYLVGIGMFTASLGLLGYSFDRYIMSFLPFVILFMVRGSSAWGRAAWAYSIATFVLLAAFTLTSKADFVDHNNARWSAGKWVYAHTRSVRMGYDWDYWVGNRSDVYWISDLPKEGYRVERQFHYLSRLSGFETRYVLALVRNDAPRLPVPGPPP